MTAIKILKNPFVLAAKGFIAGAVLFWTLTAAEVDAAPLTGTAQPASEKIAGA